MSAYTVVLGAVLLLAIGNVLQKKGHLHRQASRSKFQHPILGLLFNGYWILGIAAATGGTLLYNYALVNPHWSITIIQPLMAFNPVLTGLLAFLLLKESLSRASLESTAIVIFGVVLLGFSLENEPVVFSEFQTNICLLGMAICAVGLAFLKDKELKYAFLAGLAFGMAAILLKASSYTVPVEEFDALNITSTHSVIQYGITLVSQYYLWLYGVVFVGAFILFQMGFAHGRAVIIVSYSAALGMVAPVIAGFIGFGETISVLKIAGIGIIVFGIVRPSLNSSDVPIQQ